MADITFQCPSCGNTIQVSEFIESPTLTCIQCRTVVPIPARQPEVSDQTRPRLTMRAPEEPAAQEPPPPKPRRSLFGGRRKARTGETASSLNTFQTVQAKMPSVRRRVRNRKVNAFLNKVVPWAAFVLMTLVFCWMRFWPGAVPPARLTILIESAGWALLVLHITVIVFAFGEDPFQGVLCALIPGYSLYFLFTQADQYILRALVAAMLIAFGWDTGIAIRKGWQGFYKTTNMWLQDTDSFQNSGPSKVKRK